ncbi:MAG TPA: thioredoxin domain-containing protein, partial [Candidatus Dormibacteraeota bacterium]|nr:thioredoxin domain-containing protein [Candidatus Dormibacteraeota bacterium]
LRAQISEYLAQQKEAQLEQTLADKMRKGASIRILLEEPEPPVQQVKPGNGPARGDMNAAVTIVEFTDFQCSACGAMYPVMEEVLKSYGNRVRFVIRNFPLTSLHPYAFKAAEAAKAASEQGKFWEYIDRLFHNQNALDDASLKKYASEVGLDRKRFDAELDGGVHAAEIQSDVEDGELYGIEATPTIFINGVMLEELSADAVREEIERAFKKLR